MEQNQMNNLNESVLMDEIGFMAKIDQNCSPSQLCMQLKERM
jgi:hypothetical protein